MRSRSSSATARATDADRNYDRLVLIVSAVYWLLLLEGALRKWVLPQFQRELFFVRDPLVLLAYLAVWRCHLGLFRSPMLWIGASFAAATVPLMLYQYAVESPKFVWLLAVYGWRNYFLYLPLPFVIAKCFARRDVETLIRRTLWLTIPVAALVYFQFVSSPTATINQGSGDSENTFSGLALTQGTIRPLGTFTSNQGQNPFVVASVSMLFIAWMTPAIRTRMKTIGLLAATCGTLSMVGLSGSRTVVLWSALVVVSAIATGLLASRKRSFALVLVPVAGLLLAVGGLPLVYPNATAAFRERWESANKFEVEVHGSAGVFSRAFNDLFLFQHLMTDDHLEGYQMGIGGNAAYLMGLRDSMMHLETYQQGIAIESEWGKHIADMGVLGVMFIVYRIAFVGWLLIMAIGATWRTGDAHPILLFGFVGPLLLDGQITGQGSQNGFVWLFVGFLLAVSRPRVTGTRAVVRREIESPGVGARFALAPGGAKC